MAVLNYLSEFIFIMSFGSKQYQHRFYNDGKHKKGSLVSTVDSYPLPLIGRQSQQFPQYSPYRNPPLLTNELNLRTRAGPLRMNEPGWEAYRIKSYVTDQYSQDYQQNADMLEWFRRDAEDYRRRLRFASQDQRYSLSRNEYSPFSGIYRQIQDNRAKIQQLKRSMIYSPNNPYNPYNPSNPQILKYYQDLDLKTRLATYELERSNMISKLQINDSIAKNKLKDYKKKYSKLKGKLKQEMFYKQKEQMQNLRLKEVRAIEKENDKLEDIQKMLSNLSTGLQRNSELINQSLKLNSQISNNSQTLGPSSVVNKSPNQKYAKMFVDEQKQLLSEEQNDVKLPRLSPKIIYTKKKLQSQYQQLEKLKKYIENIDSRIKRLKTE